MSQTATSAPATWWAGLSEVRVIEAGVHSVTVSSPGGGRVQARLATPGYQPRAGDRVVVGAGPGGVWVVGVSQALRPVDEVESGGVRAAPTEAGDGVEVRDADGELLFRRTEDGTTVVSIGAGDLELRAPHGTVRLSGRAIEVDAVRSVTIGADEARVKVTPQTVSVRGPKIDVGTDEGVARFERAELVAGAIDVVARLARSRIDHVETRAKKIVERAAETYRHVDELALTRAGRVRTLVDDAYHLVSRYAKLRAREDIAIDGEQIRLG